MSVFNHRISIAYAQYQPNDAQEDYAKIYHFYLDTRSFNYGTNILQINIMEKIHNFIFTELTRFFLEVPTRY